MPLIPLRTLLDHAAEHDYGVAAFNVNNLEQIQAVMEAAQVIDAPVIIQASRAAREYCRDAYLRHLIGAAVELYPQIPLTLHLDHGSSVPECDSAMEQGFTSVMIDGSVSPDGATPAAYPDNVRLTREVVDIARVRGVSVEGKLGAPISRDAVASEPDQEHGTVESQSLEQQLTDPAEAEQFVHETQIDALDVVIGTSRGAYKFSRPPEGNILAMDRIQAIHQRLPNTHLVMHGSSSLTQHLQDMINHYGGDISQTWGVPLEEIRIGIQNGIRKINVDTDNRLAMTGAIRKLLFENPETFNPRVYLAAARAAMQQVCQERMEAFGQAGRAAGLRRQ